MPQTEHVSAQSPFISESHNNPIEYPEYTHESPTPNDVTPSNIRISTIVPVAQFIFKVMGIFGLGAIIGHLAGTILKLIIG